METAIVAPVHIQPSEEWVSALKTEAEKTKTRVIIVDDSDGKVTLPESFDVYGYARQRELLGDKLYKQFEKFHKSSACKQFGIWVALKLGMDSIIVIDSDCIVQKGFVKQHLDKLYELGDGWENPLKSEGVYSRGFPFKKRGALKAAHMGLWDNEWDLYGIDRISLEKMGHPFKPRPTPPHLHSKSVSGVFPLSGMNVSFTRQAAPYMLFLPNFKYKSKLFTRHDDIWGGYIFQKIMHEKNECLSYGMPHVFHDTVVDANADALAEEMMIEHEDSFYETVDDSVLFTQGEVSNMGATTAYKFLAKTFKKSPVFSGLEDAFNFWSAATKLLDD